MSLAAKLEAARPVLKTRIEQYVESLDETDRAALIGAANDRAWSNAALMRILSGEGVSVGKESFGAWRHSVSRG